MPTAKEIQVQVPSDADTEEEVQNIPSGEAEELSLQKDQDQEDAINVTQAESEQIAPPSTVSTTTSSSSSSSTRNNLNVTTTLPPFSPAVESPKSPAEEPVQYVDERSKAMGRKAELEELRNRNELTKKKAAFNADCSPMSTATLASFFLQQKQMKNKVRQHRLGALSSLKDFRLKECNMTPKTNKQQRTPYGMPASAYSTMTDVNDFFRKQKQLDVEWRRNKEKAFMRLHMYRQEHIHNGSNDGTERCLEEGVVATNSSEPDANSSNNNDTVVFNSLLLLHAELKLCFNALSSAEMDAVEEEVEADYPLPHKLSLDQVLDPFTGTRASFEENENESASQKGSAEKSCPLTNPGEDYLFVEGFNDQRVQIVENMPTVASSSSVQKADSTVSSIGSSLDESGGRISSVHSSSSLSTFWQEDLPPLPDAKDEFAVLLTCNSEQYIPNLHSSRGPCERCLALASEEERAKFLEAGRHVRIMIVKGGCCRTCTAFPRGEDDPPVRLCRKCYFDTHRPRRSSTQGRAIFSP